MHDSAVLPRVNMGMFPVDTWKDSFNLKLFLYVKQDVMC